MRALILRLLRETKKLIVLLMLPQARSCFLHILGAEDYNFLLLPTPPKHGQTMVPTGPTFSIGDPDVVLQSLITGSLILIDTLT